MTDLDPVVSLVGPGGAVQVGAGARVGAEAGAGPRAIGGLVVLVKVGSPESQEMFIYVCDMRSLTQRVLDCVTFQNYKMSGQHK